MKDENGNEIVEVNAGQQTEINDIVEGFLPSVETSEVAPVVETKTDGGNESVKEGEERTKEETGGQEQVGEPTQKVEGEVKPVEGEVKPVVPAEPPVEPSELEQLKATNKMLIDRLNEVAGKVVGPKEIKPPTPEEAEAQKRSDEQQAKQILKFIPSNEVFDEVMKDSNNFNAVLTSVVNTAVERSLRLMPQIATQLVEQQMNLKTAVNSFYTDNKDLEPHKKYVGFVANEISAQHSDWGLQQILQETEKEVRNRLKLNRVVNGDLTVGQTSVGTSHTAPSNPGFVPGSGGGRRGSTSSDGNLTAMEKDISSLIS
jgi:hypothetical protein